MGDKASELVDTRFHKGSFVSQTWKKKMKLSSSSPFEQRCAAFRATCKTDNKHSNFERSSAEGRKGADCFFSEIPICGHYTVKTRYYTKNLVLEPV